MLDSVLAVRFDKRMGSGKTKPCLLACMKPDGEEVELIAKFSAGTERGNMALAVEGIAAMLAADLALCPYRSLFVWTSMRNSSRPSPIQ